MSEAEEHDAEELGPAMLALPTDKQRAFVMALYSDDDDVPPKGEGLYLFAAKAAGFGTETSSNKSLSVIASRLLRSPRVRAAIAEYSHTTLRAIPPEAVRALRAVIRDPKHRDHMRAINAIIDRVDPLEHVVKLTDDRPPSIEATAAVLDRMEQLARRAGLLLPPTTIDAEFSEVA